MKKKILMLAMAVIFAILPTFSRDIKGRILGENNIPLDFVNVVLYCDSTYIAGGISDSEGNFTIPTAVDCNLIAKVSFTGYEPIVANVPQSGNLGVITLRQSTVELGEVVVKATRPTTTMKGNALVTNVEGSSSRLPELPTMYLCEYR